eukprot:902538-Prymnesium_polylepis.1
MAISSLWHHLSPFQRLKCQDDSKQCEHLLQLWGVIFCFLRLGTAYRCRRVLAPETHFRSGARRMCPTTNRCCPQDSIMWVPDLGLSLRVRPGMT